MQQSPIENPLQTTEKAPETATSTTSTKPVTTPLLVHKIPAIKEPVAIIKPKPTTPMDPKLEKALADEDRATKEKHLKKTGQDVIKPDDTEKITAVAPPNPEDEKAPAGIGKGIIQNTLSRDKLDLAGGVKWVRPTTLRHITKEDLIKHFIEGKEIEPDDLMDPNTPSPILPYQKDGIKLRKTMETQKPINSDPLLFDDAESTMIDPNNL